MKKIALVGCGNIGSRHLQALVKLPYKTEIQIVEPSETSRNLAKSRINEINYDKSNFFLSWNDSINDIKETDLVILATHSTIRVELVEKLLELKNSRFLLEKVVCQSEDQFEHLLSIVNSKNAKSWVNTPRRYFNSYKKLKKQFKENEDTNFILNCGNTGLGSNAIHFIDLFLWLIESEEITLMGDYLDPELLSNRRGQEFKEFSGTIVGQSSNSNLTLNFLPYDEIPVLISIFNKKFSFLINETEQKIYDLRTFQQINDFKMEFQSNLTTKIANDIIKHDKCLLPTIKETKKAHFELFRIFNNHIKKITNVEVKNCPIT